MFKIKKFILSFLIFSLVSINQLLAKENTPVKNNQRVTNNSLKKDTDINCAYLFYNICFFYFL